MRFFTMRLVAPVATIRGPVVGDDAYAQPIPAPSFIVGLIGAALGIERAQANRLARIHESITVAWLIHREPKVVQDLQTCNISQEAPHNYLHTIHRDALGLRVLRRGGSDPMGKKGRKIHRRDLTHNVDMTAIIGWDLDDLTPEEVLEALDFPRETLTIGAKWALPSESIAGTILDVSTLSEAIAVTQSDHPAIRSYIPLEFGEVPTGPIFELSSRVFNPFAYSQFGGQYRYHVRSAA